MKNSDDKWFVRFEVTFHGVDDGGKPFREIKENTISFNFNIKIPNLLPFTSKENVEINFLLWVDGISPEKLVPLPHDYFSKNVRYGEETIEVLDVFKE